MASLEGRMRFRTSVRMVMGLAAAGSAIVAFSGTAAAADATGVAVPQPASQQTTATVPTAPSVSAMNVQASGQDSKNSSQNSTVQSTSTVKTSSTDSNNSTSDTAAKAQPSSVSNDSSNGTQGSDADKVIVGQGGSAQPNAAENMVPKSTSNVTASVPDSAKVEAAVHPGTSSLPALPPVVRFRSEMLPVQPTIVSYEAAPVDLASALPSAPQQRQQPHPAKSTGMLGSLTAVLAGTVVPQPLMLGGMGIVPLGTVLLFGLIAALLFTVFVFTYGSWLRLGGFATAARSDEPVTSNISSIATPLFLGYVMSLLRMHNPILVVADTEIFYKVLPPMLTERRIRI